MATNNDMADKVIAFSVGAIVAFMVSALAAHIHATAYLTSTLPIVSPVAVQVGCCCCERVEVCE